MIVRRYAWWAELRPAALMPPNPAMTGRDFICVAPGGVDVTDVEHYPRSAGRPQRRGRAERAPSLAAGLKNQMASDTELPPGYPVTISSPSASRSPAVAGKERGKCPDA
jgi:hypothetical protein